MTFSEYKLASLHFKLPTGYFEISKREDKIASFIPDQTPTTEYFFSFQNSSGKKLYLFYWQGFPWRDYGPMSIKKTFTAKIGNITYKIILTSMFMGDKQEVLVTHYQLPNNDRFMVYSPDIKLKEFKKFISILKIK